ncbi:hypothetical protein D9V41_02810 [Aeromicrobium phragmitis]|uniref:Tripartite tricarboxylate transporter substrate binding protein n=1 Tax=Aeromicrobium phragmitis TaxID=2478914 RepID=A0A3L8PU60_9ACTN|nr:hypothetical protein [Aeromicrobium phragmitis]RLV57572.1 hypothetical protein D9V41_02810 [Aeromicrobium phragmitis]
MSITFARSRQSTTVMCVFTALAVAAAFLGGSPFSSAADTADGDFSKETLEVMIPLAEGGGTDTWARFVGQELAPRVTGGPGFSPVNEPGGEGITGSNQFARRAPADGTHLLVSTATSVVPWVLGRSEVNYDFAQMTPVVVNGTGGAIYARKAAGVEGLRDLVDRDTPLTFGGISATGLDLTTLVAFDVLGVDQRSIFGFEGRGPVNLAVQRGEVDLDYQTTSAWEPSVGPLLQNGSVVPLVSFGQLDEDGEVVRDTNFPDLPTVAEAYEELYGEAPSGPAWEAYTALLGVTYTYQKGLWVPGETSEGASESLRKAADDLSGDKAFNDKAAEVLGGYPLVADDGVKERVAEVYVVDDSVREYVLSLLRDTYDIHLG